MPSRLLTTLTAVAAVALTAPTAAHADFRHVVSPGESLSSIAAADGLSVTALAAANGLSSATALEVGQVLDIPPQGETIVAGPDAGSGADPDGVAAVPAGSAGGYEVVPGDTLSAIAARAGVSTRTLAAVNGLSADGVLVTGTVLRLPGALAAAGAATGPGNQQLPGAVGTGPYPTREDVTGGQVGAEASARGVDPSLAEAVGWQESGYSNALVSSTGAVGVMQIEPATWSWINAELTPGAPLDPASALANVRGGVLLLHHLVAATGSDAMAAAAYYQGLASIREHGLYRSTERYVADVMALKARFGG